MLDRPKMSSVRPPAISLPHDVPIPKAAPTPHFESAPQVSEIYVPPAQRSGATGTGTITVLLREQRKRRLVWIGALAVTLIVVVAAFFGMRDAEKETSTASSASAPRATTVASTPSTTASPTAVATVATPESDAASGPPRGMVLIPAATFTMGSDTGRSEKPQHKVRITRDFYIDLTEVTADAYGACVHDHACTAPRFHTASRGRGVTTSSTSCNSISDPSFARQPANCVTYEQSVAFCKHEGKRLPTEAEWEYAARGTDARTYPWGEAESHSCRFAITGGAEGPCGARKGTYEVATTVDGKSPFGLFDMAGNVWEWVADDFEGYGKDEVVDPIIPPRSSKGVIRGGSWDYSAATAKTYVRLSHDRAFALNNVGFRCARDGTP